MHMFLLPLATLAASYASAASINGASRGTARSFDCVNESIISQETLESGVVVTQRQCLDIPVTPKRDASNELEKRTTTDYLCAESGGTSCQTDCYGGSAGGPNQDDCNFIASVIGGSSGDIVTYRGTSWTYSWNSCEARFFNQINQDYDVSISICPSAFAGTITWLSGDCNAASDAHGGKCLSDSTYATAPEGCDADDCTHPEWFIDVVHT